MTTPSSMRQDKTLPQRSWGILLVTTTEGSKTLEVVKHGDWPATRLDINSAGVVTGEPTPCEIPLSEPTAVTLGPTQTNPAKSWRVLTVTDGDGDASYALPTSSILGIETIDRSGSGSQRQQNIIVRFNVGDIQVFTYTPDNR